MILILWTLFQLGRAALPEDCDYDLTGTWFDPFKDENFPMVQITPCSWTFAGKWGMTMSGSKVLYDLGGENPYEGTVEKNGMEIFITAFSLRLTKVIESTTTSQIPEETPEVALTEQNSTQGVYVVFGYSVKGKFGVARSIVAELKETTVKGLQKAWYNYENSTYIGDEVEKCVYMQGKLGRSGGELDVMDALESGTMSKRPYVGVPVSRYEYKPKRDPRAPLVDEWATSKPASHKRDPRPALSGDWALPVSAPQDAMPTVSI